VSCRNSDIMGRLGGDEFIASYHRTELQTMEKSIAAIRAKMRSRPMQFGDAEHRLSFSYGLARFPDDGTDQASLVAAADKRLYAMKSAIQPA
jgi:diguanylate cyclase (GGDEF)-like protein